MFDFDENVLENLTKLCRIDCTGEEKKELFQNLSHILKYIDEMSELDLKDVAPCHHVIPSQKNLPREDIPKITLARDDFLDNSPSHISGMIRVPPIMNKDQ